MYLITLKLQKARSRQDPDKPGKVYLNIIERESMEDGTVRLLTRNVNTGIEVPKGGKLQDFRDESRLYVYNAYLVIDKLCKSGPVFTIDDVAHRLREVIANDEFMTRVSDDFVWDAEVATLKNDLIPLFRYKKQYRQHAVNEETDMDGESLSGFLYSMSRKMLSEGHESTSNAYMSTRLSLRKFLEDKEKPLADVDHKFIEDYAGWLKETGVADSTQSFYLRTLRAGINYAIKEGIADLPDDMFRKVNTRIRFDRNVENPACLDREEILKLANIDLSGFGKLDLARDMFMFGFYCKGMELTDIINLTTDNLDGNVLTYRRRGTGKEISLQLNLHARAILKKYDNRLSEYLFPLKTSHSMKLDKTMKYKVTLWLKKVGEMVGIESLSFIMNITSWNRLLSQTNFQEALFAQG